MHEFGEAPRGGLQHGAALFPTVGHLRDGHRLWGRARPGGLRAALWGTPASTLGSGASGIELRATHAHAHPWPGVATIRVVAIVKAQVVAKPRRAGFRISILPHETLQKKRVGSSVPFHMEWSDLVHYN